MIVCTICESHVKGREKIMVAQCGHAFHYSCMENIVKSKSKHYIVCPVSTCRAKTTNDNIIYIAIPRWTRDDRASFLCGAAEEGTPETHAQNSQICSICKIDMSDPKNESVTKCGHTFHFQCVKEYVNNREKRIKCPVTNCEAIITRDSYVKIQQNVQRRTTQREDNQRWADAQTPLNDNVSPLKQLQKCKKNEEWEAVCKLILDSYKNPNDKISLEAAQHLRTKIEGLIGTQKCKTPSEDKLKAGPLTPWNDKPPLLKQSHCQNCVRNVKKIVTLEKKMYTMKKKMMDYFKTSKELKQENIIAMEQGRSSIAHLRKANVKKLSEIKKQTKEIADLRKKIEDLEKPKEQQASSAQTDLNEANPQLEIKKLKEYGEKMEELIEILQSQANTYREVNISHETLQAELKAQNEDLTKQNEEMRTDLESLHQEFAVHDATITDLLINELQSTLDSKIVLRKLHKDIGNLKEYNEDLRKENDQLKSIMDNRFYNDFPGTSMKTASEI